jgi:TRAP-type mannitol/chloroaromatic compound transport system permease small subunit
MDRMLATSDAINKFLERVAMAAGWLFLVLTAVIVFDVLSRKFGFQLPGMGSTRLQELEWHLHTALFSFWLGVGYIKNAHVRIDILVANLSPRKQAWTELAGCVLFALPYCVLAIYFSLDFTWIAWVDNEGSPSANGLPWRWIPKGFISIGLIMLLAGVISVMLRILVFLYGPERLRKASSFAAFQILD